MTPRRSILIITLLALLGVLLTLVFPTDDRSREELGNAAPRYDPDHTFEVPRRTHVERPAAPPLEPTQTRSSSPRPSRRVRVRSLKGDEPVSSAQIEIRDAAGNRLGTGTTDEEGLCRVELEAGTPALVRVDHPAYVPLSAKISDVASERGDAPIDVALAPTGSIRGRIARRDGTSRPGMVVTAHIIDWSPEQSALWSSFERPVLKLSAKTDTEGYFLMKGLPPGAGYRLKIDLPRGTTIQPNASEIYTKVDDPPLEYLLTELYGVRVELIDAKTEEAITTSLDVRVDIAKDLSPRFHWFFAGFMAMTGSETADFSKEARSGRFFLFSDTVGGPPEALRAQITVHVPGFEPATRDLLMSPLSLEEPEVQRIELQRRPDWALVRLVLPDDMYADRDTRSPVTLEPLARDRIPLHFMDLTFSRGRSGSIAVRAGRYRVEYGSVQWTQVTVDASSREIVLDGLVPGATVLVAPPPRSPPGDPRYILSMFHRTDAPGLTYWDGSRGRSPSPLRFRDVPPGTYRVQLRYEDSDEAFTFDWKLTPEMVGPSPVHCRPDQH